MKRDLHLERFAMPKPARAVLDLLPLRIEALAHATVCHPHALNGVVVHPQSVPIRGAGGSAAVGIHNLAADPRGDAADERGAVT